MSNSEPPSPVLFFDTLTAYQNTAALKAALELKLFTAIGQSRATAAELAAECGATERGIRILADYLTILGFLEKNGDRYSLTRDSATFLDQKSPAYAGGAAAFLLSPTIRGAFDELAAAVRKGGTAQSEEGTMAPEHPVWIDFARGMAPMMTPPAQLLAGLLPLDATRPSRILDIAAGPRSVWNRGGAKTSAGATRRARLGARAGSGARKRKGRRSRGSLQHDRGQRLRGRSGRKLRRRARPEFSSSLRSADLRNLPEEECIRALRPGGCVAIVEFVPNPDRVTPPEAASFSLVMLATTAARRRLHF